MRCNLWQEAFSSQLDGEDPGVAPEAIANHVASCIRCGTYAARARAVHQAVRVRPAENVPDLVPGVLAANRELAAVPSTIDWLRFALASVALIELVLAVPALLGSGPGASAHVARELGGWDIALAVGFLVTAFQPSRAWGLLPAALALGAVMAGTAIFDVLAGRTMFLGESHHALEFVGLFLLWVLARRERPTSTPTVRIWRLS